MTNTFSVIFIQKKNNSYSIEGSIYLRVTINGKRLEISIKKSCPFNDWDGKAGRISSKTEEAKQTNSLIDTIYRRAFKVYEELINEGKPISTDTFKNKYLGTEERGKTILVIHQQHNSQVNELIGREYAAGTAERYATSLRHLQNFIIWRYKVKDKPINEINHSFIMDYEHYLRTVRKCATNSAVKYVKNFKKIIRICLASGWIDKDPFVNYKSKVKQVERAYLSEEELNTMLNMRFTHQRLEAVKDMFLFSCFTGLAYADVSKLTKDDIVTGIDGDKWIQTFRTKTKTRSSVPLLPQTKFIIEKYRDTPVCIIKNKLLPVLSNQKMNAYLKEIATLCGITKELTYHIARHTFATTVTLSNGVPIESVSKMLGHTNLRTTQHYAKILDRKVSDDMAILKSKYVTKQAPTQEVLKVAN